MQLVPNIVERNTPIVQPSVFEKCVDFTRHRELQRVRLYPYFHRLESAQEPEVLCEGKPMIMMSSNNYLGLATDRRVKEAAISAVNRFGAGCTGSRLLNGTLDLHAKLEEKLASFLSKPSAIVFPTGFQANLGAISALVGKNEQIVVDKMNHASIYDGSRLSFGRLRKYRHNDMHDLDRILNQQPDRGSLVVADGVFSMEGDMVDLPNLVKTCQRHSAGILIDDAHGLGVLGTTGRGTAEHFNLQPEVDLIMTTFSKSLGTVGGCIAGPSDVVEYIKHHARALIFSASLTPASTAAALRALDILEKEPERRQRLWRNAKYLAGGLRKLGYDTGPSETPIVPVFINDEEKVLVIWRKLFDEGVFTSPVMSPAVPPGISLIRTSCMATHTIEHLDQVLDAFAYVRRELSLS